MSNQIIYDRYGKPIKKVNLQKVYNAGPRLSSLGFLDVLGDYSNPDEVDTEIYRRMFEYDETVNSGIKFVTLAVLARLGEYTHKNEEIMEFMRKQFERIHGSLHWIAYQIISTGLWAGFSVGEKILEFADGKVQLYDVQFLSPETVTFELYKKGINKNRIKTVKQNGLLLNYGNDSEIPPVDKFIIYSHDPQEMNPYGTSRLRCVYSPYCLKIAKLKDWALTLERFGTPLISAEIENDTEPNIDIGDERVSIFDFIASSMNTLQASTGIVLPKGVSLKIDRPNGDVGKCFEQIIEYCNKMIYRGLMLPGLVANTDKNGSRSLGEVHESLFISAMEKIKRDLTEVLLEQLIRPLITWNFGVQDSWGNFITQEYKPEVGKMFAEIFEKLTTQEYISPDNFNDLNFVRQKTGLPGVSEHEFKKIREEKENRHLEMLKHLDKKKDEDKISKEDDGESNKKENQEKNFGDKEYFDKFEGVLKNLNGVDTFFNLG